MWIIRELTQDRVVLLFVVAAPIVLTIVASLSIRNVPVSVAISIIGSLGTLAVVVLTFLGTRVSPDDKLVLLIFVVLWGLASSAITATLMRLGRHRTPTGMTSSK